MSLRLAQAASMTVRRSTPLAARVTSSSNPGGQMWTVRLIGDDSRRLPRRRLMLRLKRTHMPGAHSTYAADCVSTSHWAALVDLEEGRHAWLASLGRVDLSEAGCLTAVTGLTVDEALAAFGAELDSPMTVEESGEALIASVAAVPPAAAQAVGRWLDRLRRSGNHQDLRPPLRRRPLHRLRGPHRPRLLSRRRSSTGTTPARRAPSTPRARRHRAAVHGLDHAGRACPLRRRLQR